MSTTSAVALIEKLRQNAEQVEALTLLWQSLLPAESLPPYTQLILWLCRFGFEPIEIAIQKTGAKFLRVRGEMDRAYLGKYCSSVLASASRETGDARGNH